MNLDQIAVFQHALDTQGPVASMPFGPREGWIVADPVSIDHVLKSPGYGKGEAWKPMRRLLFPTSGALSANDDPASWRAFRIPVNRSLAPATIKSLVAPMASIVDEEIANWPRGVPFELSAACGRIIQKLIVWVFFGAGISAKESDEIGAALVSVLRLIAEEQHGGSEAVAAEHTKTLQDALVRLIRESDRGIVTTFTELDPVVGSEILLNLFLAGYETPSLAVSWTLALLAQNRSIEVELLKEIDQAGPDSVPGLDTLERWPVLAAVLNESMRLYTPLWAFPREAFADDVLPSGHAIATGSILMLSVLHMHRSPSIWGADASQFNPARFIDSSCNPVARDRRVYLPFGAGMRVCPAEILSRVEMMICLCQIIRSFDIELLAPVEWEPAFTLRPKGGIHVIVSPRNSTPTT
jgi:cytochrome P450